MAVSSPQTSAHDTGPRERSPWLVLTVLCMGFFMILLDTTIVNIALPSLTVGLTA